MIARRNELDDALAGCGPDTIRRSVGLLRSVMAVQQVDDETKKLQRAAYLQVLSPYPAWAVETACMQFLAASRGEGIHAPKPGEIAAVCRVLVAEGRAERAGINAVLDAEIVPAPTEEDRKRVQERYEAFVREATARAADTKAMLDSRKSDIPTEDRQAALDDLKRREERRLAEEEKA